MSTAKKILQELVYERVRGSVNLCQLVIFERDLGNSVGRVVGADRPADDVPRLTREYIDEAWQRLEEEWHEMRARFDDMDID